jgi:hypothetical protein
MHIIQLVLYMRAIVCQALRLIKAQQCVVGRLDLRGVSSSP